ncbi:MAG TPA: PLP-dependent aminotransferase family protein [Myxococcales bacterium]|jgi:2-aminoadipate transaminase|nr:PLP-dependent aminotransferase family protein [Myxococcales bacterium]
MIELAKRMSGVQASAIREILKVTERPDVLSFAGGLPAPEAFPAAALAQAHADVLATDAAGALQYGPTEGYAPLRALIAERMTLRGLPAASENVLVTAGSQQGIDLVGKALIDPGDVVAVEAPSYLAALQSFSTYEARFETVPGDEEGMRVDALEQVLRERRPKLIYVVPTFQNPRGTTLPLERRVRIAQLAAAYGVTVLEDDPYGELRYRGAALPPIAGLVPGAPVIYLGSFSKTLAPGLRLGYAVADERIVRALTIAKQAADLHSGSLSQRAVTRLFQIFDYEAHLRRLQRLYVERLDAMLASIERSFPPGTRWTEPAGGLFVWVQLPQGLDAQALLAEAMREGVAFVPGAPFYPRDPRRETMRLNFSNRPPEAIAEGMARLGACVRARLRVRSASPEAPPRIAG